MVSVGAAVAITNVAPNTEAYISSSGTLSAGGSLTVNANYGLNRSGQDIGDAYAGEAGLGAGAGAIVIANDNSTELAYIGGSTQITNAASLNVGATADVTLDLTTGAVAAGLVAAGASVAEGSVGGSTQAYVGGGVQIGESTGSVGGVTVSAESTVSAQTKTYAIAAGIGAGSVNISQDTVTPSVSAAIDTGAVLSVTGNVDVYAGTDHNASANLFSLSVGLLAGGVSEATANIDPTVSATIGGQVTAGGNISVIAGHEVDPVSLQPVNDAFGGAVRGAFAYAEAPSVADRHGVRLVVKPIRRPRCGRRRFRRRTHRRGRDDHTAEGIDSAYAKGNGFSLTSLASV